MKNSELGHFLKTWSKYVLLRFLHLLQDSFSGQKVLDDFGLLTIYREPTNLEFESFGNLHDLETEKKRSPFTPSVRTDVRSASLVILSTIMGEEIAAEAIEKVSFLKWVS